MGKIDFGGVFKEASLAYIPEVKVGDYVIVHVGFAISQVDEEEAAKVFEYLAGNGRTCRPGGGRARGRLTAQRDRGVRPHEIH